MILVHREEILDVIKLYLLTSFPTLHDKVFKNSKAAVIFHARYSEIMRVWV